MTNSATHKPIKVSEGGKAGAYIIVPLSQVPAVRRLLEEHAVPHWADETAISLDGRPAVVFINLSPGTDVPAVQAILDAA